MKTFPITHRQMPKFRWQIAENRLILTLTTKFIISLTVANMYEKKINCSSCQLFDINYRISTRLPSTHTHNQNAKWYSKTGNQLFCSEYTAFRIICGSQFYCDKQSVHFGSGMKWWSSLNRHLRPLFETSCENHLCK